MYSPTTRLLTLLELLQSYRQMSGSEIAQRLEVDGRTVRRYIVMLQDMGIPVEAERGPYGTYQLQRGYKLPPLMFTDSEAVALTLGLLTIREFHFPVDVAAVEGALAKTERVMPEKLLSQVRGLQEAVKFNVEPVPVLLQNDFLAILSSAAQQRQQVFMRYQSWRGEASEEQSFELPADFDVLSYVLRSVALIPEIDQVEVLMETTMVRAQEIISQVMGTIEPSENGGIFRRAANQLQWIAHVLIALDFPVHVIRPVELRDLIRQLGKKALQMVGE